MKGDRTAADSHTFNMFWHAGDLPPFGARMRLFAYEAVPAPSGVELSDAREVVATSDPLYEACAGRSIAAPSQALAVRLVRNEPASHPTAGFDRASDPDRA